MKLADFLSRHLKEHGLNAELGSLMLCTAEACAEISSHVRLGDLAGVLGEAGSGNIQGEEQKKLDVLANDILIRAFAGHTAVAGLASEEEENFLAADPKGRYLVLFDPLDGSSNTDVNISVGTIVSVLEKPISGLSASSFLQAGRFQVASAYALYGPQTQLVICLRHGVYVFTLNARQEFILTRSSVRIPESTQEFAINMSNRRHWQPPVRRYIDELLSGSEGVRGKNYNMRWVASMVAEVHRILMRGGVFMYPADTRDPAKPGKLRLMYEANPLSLIVEQAGGAAGNTRQNMLDIVPDSLHQRVPVVLGSREEVVYLTGLHEDGSLSV